MESSPTDEDLYGLHLLADASIQQSLEGLSLKNPTYPTVFPSAIPKKKRSSADIYSTKPATATSPIICPNNDREVDHGKGKSSSSSSSTSTSTFNENNNNNNKMVITNIVQDDQHGPNPPPESSSGSRSDVRLVIQDHGPNPPPELSSEFVDRIKNMGGTDVRLVMQKRLYKTDVKEGNNRLSMPCSGLKCEFLTDTEMAVLNTVEENDRNRKGIQVSVIEPCREVTNLCLKKWDYKCNSSALVFVTDWNSVVKKNGLKVGDVVQVWSFRVGAVLHFAIVKLEPHLINQNQQ